MSQSRRDFIALTARCAACAAASTTAAGVLAGCAETTPPVLPEDVTLRLSDFPVLATEGGVATLSTSQTGYPHPMYVRYEGGQVYRVLGGWCDHEGCSVRNTSSGYECVCHGATFSQTGRRRSGPARNGLPQFDSMVDGDLLTILAN